MMPQENSAGWLTPGPRRQRAGHREWRPPAPSRRQNFPPGGS